MQSPTPLSCANGPTDTAAVFGGPTVAFDVRFNK
jgi:hypothetical protein